MGDAVVPTLQFAASDTYTASMPAALPLVTRQEIVRDFRLDEAGTIDNGIRALKDKHALSPGLSFTTRGTAGRLGGRVHLYSALNRDAARAARRKDFATAERLAKAAARLDASPEAKKIVAALSTIAGAGGIGSAADLARLLAAPQLAVEVTGLQRKLARARRGLDAETTPAQFSGRIVALNDVAAMLDLQGLPAPVPVPAVTVHVLGVGAVGSPVVACWEILAGGRTMLSVEPAIEMPDVNELGEPLVDVYGTPGEGAQRRRSRSFGGLRHADRTHPGRHPRRGVKAADLQIRACSRRPGDARALQLQHRGAVGSRCRGADPRPLPLRYLDTPPYFDGRMLLGFEPPASCWSSAPTRRALVSRDVGYTEMIAVARRRALLVECRTASRSASATSCCW